MLEHTYINILFFSQKGPHVLKNPTIFENQRYLKLELKLSAPWLILVRICASSVSTPTKVKNVQIRYIDNTKILILWKDHPYSNYERCVRTYEIYYAPPQTLRRANMTATLKWIQINQNKHTPFLSYCHHIFRNQQLEGFY